MSAVDPFSRGSTLLTFRFVERVSPSVWQAEDTRNGKKVAIKLLSRQLPKDAAKREGYIRDVRLGAAIYHPALVNIIEITAAGDALLLIMEWIDGQPISARVRGKALDRAEFFRIAYQVVDALRFLHAKNVVHGNVAGDSILIMPSGRAKLCGLNLSNLLQRPGQPSAYQQKSGDARAVAYMSPEQISNQQVTTQSDIFSLGLVLYEAATGRAAYQAENAADVARKVVEEQPPSPKSINANVDTAVLSIMGRCLFKDPFRRHKDTKALSEEIARADPEAMKFAAEVAKTGAVPAPAAKAEVRTSILFLADVANYALQQSTDAGLATKAAARMQQVLGEAVYLFDGEVLDPFGPRMIASLPSPEKAIEAARKGEFDFSPAQQGENPIPVRLLLHAGDVEVRDGKIGGAGVTKGLEVLQALPPMKLHVSEEFLKKGRGNVRFRDVGARAGVKLYAIVEPEPQPEPEPEPEIEEEPEVVGPGEETLAAAAMAAAAAAKKKRQTLILAAAAAALVVVVGAGAGMLLLSKGKPADVNTSAHRHVKNNELPPATAATPRKIFLAPFAVEGTDPALSARAESVRLSAIEVLRGFPELQIADATANDVSAFTATVRAGATGPEIVTGTNAVPMLDASSGIQSVVQFVSAQLHLPPHPVPSAEAFNAFADAVQARAANDAAKTEAALRAAIKADPNFLAAQQMAMRFFAEQGKTSDALAAARAVLAADPANVEAARSVARASLTSGDLPSAFSAYAAVLKKDPNDLEALNVLGRYAWSSGDTQKFNDLLRRLASLPAAAAIHEPDLLVAAGKIDSAVQAYYTVEEKVQNNPALALKIGRIAVLRHSGDIAQIELKKLQDSDPNYGLHILKAYIAAQNGAKADADNELKLAQAASKPGDDFFTSAAEVAVISGDTVGALDALKHAAERKEPTGSYILSNPLFGFLANDPEFQKLRDQIAADQTAVRAALDSIAL